MVTALLLAAIVFYLMLATMIFRQDKLELVYDLNKSVVTTLATEVDASLRAAADKLRISAFFLGSGVHQNKRVFQDIVAGDPMLVRLELFEQNSNGEMVLKDELSNPDFDKTYNLTSDFYQKTLTQERAIPFKSVRANSFSVWNATIKNGPALLGLGIPVIREGAHGVPDRMLAVVGYIKPDLFLKNMKASPLTQMIILGSDGKVVVHTHPEAMVTQKDYSDLEIFKELKKTQVPIGVKEYNYHGRAELGAFAKINMGGLVIISQIESERAFFAVKSLIRRSLLYAMIISTITFIATVLFSRTLTRPLRRLMVAMQRVSDGNLDTELKIKSHDEIAVLSDSFNRMTQDLKSSRLQLEEINRELENKVKDRTKKLEEQNHAVKEAQEALLRTTRLASVGEIAGRTAHEVLNPLTSLMARIQKVQKRLNDEITSNKNLLSDIFTAWKTDFDEKGFGGLVKALEQPSKVKPGFNLLQEDLSNFNEILATWDKDLATLDADTQFLMQQAIRIEKILRQMRSLSVVSAQRSKMKIQPLIHDAINIVADLFSQNKVEVRENYSADLDEANVDRDEFIQVLTNMLRNSLQAVLENKVQKRRVEIQTTNNEEKLFIDIIDNGVGITEENRPKLFESQFSTKDREEGTGLGLSISRRFVRAFNGDLYLLKTSPQSGTVFRIELPLEKDIKQEAAA
jgi:signal transduction histidine kinase